METKQVDKDRAAGGSVVKLLRPAEDFAHDDGRLMHDLAGLNTRIAHYIFRHLDAETGQLEPISPADECQLGQELATLSELVLARADRRAASVESSTIEDEPIPVLTTQDDREPMLP